MSIPQSTLTGWGEHTKGSPLTVSASRGSRPTFDDFAKDTSVISVAIKWTTAVLTKLEMSYCLPCEYVL